MKPKALLLLVHGLGARQERWDFLKNYCSKKHIVCAAIDVPGQTPLSQWFKHIQNLQKKLTKKYPEIPLFLCGESLGGLMVYRCAAMNDQGLSGLILLAPAFKSKLRFSIIEYLAILVGTLVPKIKIKAHFTAEMCTSDTHYQKMMKSNKKETRNFPTRLYLEIAWQQIKARLDTVKIPQLFLLAGQDVMVDTKTSETIFNKKTHPHSRCIVYKGMRHALSIEKKRNIVFKDMVKWITLTSIHPKGTR
jgi:acylglycerol lipase